MKTLFSMVALAMSVAAVQAAKIDKANISNDAKFVVHLDLDAFRASKIGITLLEKIRKDEGGEKLNALAELIGFDPLSAIHGATMFGNGEEDNGILVVKHKADNTKLLAFMKLDEYYRKTEHGKHEIHGAGDRGDGKRGYVSFVNATTAVLAASRELAAEGIDLVNGKGAAVKQIPTSLVSADKKAKNAFLVAYANVEDLKEHIDNETVNQMAKRVAFVMGESDEKFILSISVDALDADAAENMENMVNGLIGFARLNQDENPEVKDILKGLKVTRNEENVSVHFSVGVNKLFELIDPALKEIDIDLPKP
ncbi:MAG: hypothetical protein VX598_00495 [Verrucomicrobiota bacterium]|mgnify:FL=1|nr:hypothetical protein [Verrucomicrobiota bacterium]|tara:strand:- start:233 stop:1162 length:930 start_codon:yes stop_codon:yes gene_type:complete